VSAAEPSAAAERAARDGSLRARDDETRPRGRGGPLPPALAEAIERATAKLAPTFPLDRLVAVSPLWGLVDRPISEAAASLEALSGARLLMPRAWYREAYREGRFGDAHLCAALAEQARLAPEGASATLTLDELRGLLFRDEPVTASAARVVDVLDAGRDVERDGSAREVVTRAVSQLCASYFDEGQASLPFDRAGGLYAAFRRTAARDRGPELALGLGSLRAAAGALPERATALVEAALDALGVPPEAWEPYLWGLLLDQNGWASWCAYRRFTARRAGRDDDAIVELLAVRLAWEWLLHDAGGAHVARGFRKALEAWPALVREARAAREHDWLLQSALELAYREPLVRALPRLAAWPIKQPAVQAVLCIDVRSEPMRRALEAASPSVQTLGFAGFFGLPLDYRPAGAGDARPQLPALLEPSLRAEDAGPLVDERRAAASLARKAAWAALKSDAASAFTFVEALGLAHAGSLVGASLAGALGGAPVGAPVGALGADARPRLVGARSGEPLTPEARCELAATMLRSMSLTRGFARLVLLTGHGSTSRNNPHAAGLDCGACGGQTGEVNARVAAALLNDLAVREGLARRGVVVPETTWFAPALHDTTTDELALLEPGLVPASHHEDARALAGWLAEASDGARRARAKRHGLSGSARELARAARARSRDWSEARPEWGLAGNAAFIAAPRARTRHLDLEGRVFLHEYRHAEDEGHRVLRLIMTAPLVVAHWINMQYYASTVEPVRYGSGNKALHDVVGGTLGVLEGQGGDLRVGLPLQSLYDGERLVHTPLRLTALFDAPRAAIDEVLASEPTVRALVMHGHVWLGQLDDDEGAVYARGPRGWSRCP
jgi:uncharacterized protein YbcC (UPF0753/DUF2309 family)